MKPLLLLLVCASMARAADIPLEWSPSPDTRVTGYVLYASTNAITATNFHSATVRVPLTNVVTMTLVDVLPATWWITVTAISSGQDYALESDPSNFLVVSVPKPAANLRTVAVEYSNTLTNWTQSGFFRVRVTGSPPTP